MVESVDVLLEQIRPLSRPEFERMVLLGMFDDEHVELLRGLLVTMSPQGGHHATVCAWLAQRLSIALGMALEVRPQLPFAADDWSEPEPDIAVSTRDHGVREHPTQTLLVIEVSESSLRKDRGVKLEIYARAGVPEYWIVDLATMTVDVHTEPTETGYQAIRRLHDGDLLQPIRLPGVVIPVAELPR